MRTESQMFALELLLYAVAFLVMGLLVGAFAGIVVVQVAVQFADEMLTREAGLLLLLTLSSVAACFLLSVSFSFYLAFYVIKREGKTKTRTEHGDETGLTK